MSRIANLSRAIATVINENVDLAAFLDTPAASWWVPEFDRKDLESLGLQCYIFPFSHEPALGVRSTVTRDESPIGMHVAAMLPRARTAESSADQFTDGARAVELAELLIELLLGQSVTDADDGFWRCIQIEHDPVISTDYAREQRVWVSYLKTMWVGGL